MERWITGQFDDGRSAEGAIEALCHEGFSVHDVSALLTERARQNNVTMAGDPDAERASPSGVADGALVAIIAGLTGTGGITLVGDGDGINALVAGPLATAVRACAGVDATKAALRDALCAVGVSPHRARELERSLKSGKIVLAVRCDDENVPKAESAFGSRSGAEARTADAGRKRMGA